MEKGTAKAGNIRMKHNAHRFGAEAMRELLGDGPMILYAFPHSADEIEVMLSIMPRCRVLAFSKDSMLRPFFETTKRAVCIKTQLGIRVAPADGAAIHSLDWFYDHYTFPIDMLLCEDATVVPGVILGGSKTLSYVRYVLLGNCPGLAQFLPDFKPLASYDGSILMQHQ